MEADSELCRSRESDIKKEIRLQIQRRRLEIVELLLCFTAFLLIFLLIVGPMRRRHRNVVLGPITVLVYTLSSSLIIYTLGLMQNATFCDDSEMFPLWAAFLMMVRLGGVDGFSTHSIRNNEGWRSFFAESLYQWFAFGSLLSLDAGEARSVLVITIFIFPLTLWKVVERAQSLKSASKSALQEEFKVIADYMGTEHQSSGPQEADPVSMRGYKYKVREDITVEEVWDCKGWLLRSSGGDPHGHLKDICLSFSLFRLLILKYAGYSMPPEAYQKTWRLIRDGLVSSNDANGHKRIFRVIELEMAFLFDLFYTKYPVILHPRFWKWKFFRFMIIPAISGAAVMLIFSNYSRYRGYSEFYSLPEEYTYSSVILTAVLTAIYVAAEFLQLLFTYTSEWAQVMWLCNYVKVKRRGKQHFENLLKVICSAYFFRWDRKLGQYSLVQCFSYRPPKFLYNRVTSILYDQKRDGQQEIATTKLTEQVKKELIRYFTANGSGYLRNGLSALRRNEVLDQLSWACDLGTQTQVIMVWHIATFFCEHQVPHEPQQIENFETATKLSRYLAYLVAFAPRLLPDHPYVTQQLFNQVVIEARSFFKGCKNLEQRIQKLRDGDPTDQTIMGRAVRLGKELVYQIKDPESNQLGNKGFIWRILAEFWAELALYIAPSDDVEAHLKHLALGGEFMTHLWALLYHAGIERDAPPPGEP